MILSAAKSEKLVQKLQCHLKHFTFNSKDIHSVQRATRRPVTAGGQTDCAIAEISGSSKGNLAELYSPRCVDYSMLTVTGA